MVNVHIPVVAGESGLAETGDGSKYIRMHFQWKDCMCNYLKDYE